MNAQPGDGRDEELLRRIRFANARPDGELDASVAEAELLSRHAQSIKRLALALRPSTTSLSDNDLDVIVNGVFVRVATAMRNKNYEFDKAFRYVVADNVGWELTDHVRRLAKRGEKETSVADVQEREPDAGLPLSLVEDARAFAARIARLGERDRKIVTARIYLGKSAKEVAAELGTSEGAINTAYSRALAKLAEDE